MRALMLRDKVQVALDAHLRRLQHSQESKADRLHLLPVGAFLIQLKQVLCPSAKAFRIYVLILNDAVVPEALALPVITDVCQLLVLVGIWRVGRGYARKLAEHGMYTMGDVARCSIGKPHDYYNEDLLYELFGVNAELLIDHAWGFEPCTMKEIKAYKSESNSLGSGQVLSCPYDFEKGRLIVREMTDLLVLDLVDKGLVTNQIVLTVGYDIENLTDITRGKNYSGPVTTDYYGRKVPKSAHGTENLKHFSSSTREIVDAALALYDRIVDPKLLVRRMYVVAGHVLPETDVPKEAKPEQLDLFTDYSHFEEDEEKEAEDRKREKKRQNAILAIQKKYGKNAILKGMNFDEGATTRERNQQVGGHRAGTEDRL